MSRVSMVIAKMASRNIAFKAVLTCDSKVQFLVAMLFENYEIKFS